MGRKPCCEKVGLKRGPWTVEEDGKLVSYITTNGICCWRALPKLAGLLRCGKSCRLRWTNYLRPDLKRGIFTEDEANLILDLHATLGNRWSRIAAQLPGRTDNEIKNYWNTRLKKRLSGQGLDPATPLPLGKRRVRDGDDSDGEDGDSGDASGSRSGNKAAKEQEVVKPVRQPRGPKPALPMLKMCRSDKALVEVKVPKVTPKSFKRSMSAGLATSNCDDDSDRSPCLSSCSTVTTKSGGKEHQHELSTLARVPSYPEAELWKCIKPSTPSSLLSTAAFLGDWDSCSLLDTPSTTTSPKSGVSSTMHFAEPTVGSSLEEFTVPDSCAEILHPIDVMATFTSQPGAAHDFGGTPCLADQPEMWSLDVEMGQPSPESLLVASTMSLNSVGFYSRVPDRPSQDLQKLSALLDLI